MENYPKWKYILVILVLIFSIIYSLPNIYSSYPSLEIVSKDTVINEQFIKTLSQELKRENINIYDSSIKGEKGYLLFSDINEQLRVYDYIYQNKNNIKATLMSYSSVPDWLTSINAYPMFLGLDLKGGVHFLLQIDVDNIKKNLLLEIKSDIKKFLILKKYRYESIYITKDNVNISIQDISLKHKIIKDVSKEFPSFVLSEINQPKNTLLITYDEKSLSRDIKSALAKNLAILRSRVDELGVSQPVIQQQGKDRIIVQLPGLQDSTRAKTILGSTATLEFRLTKGVPVDWLESNKKGKSVLNNALLYEQRVGGPILLSRQIIVGGKDIKGANSGFDSTTNSPAVFVNLSDYGASRMLSTTSKNVGNRMAVIFVEKNKNEVINVSRIREAFGQRFQITGLDLEEAKDLAILLRSGSLSAPMSIVEERTVGPTLGKYNIISGKQSMYLGLLLVCLFMFIYYRFFGFVSIVALIVNILLIIAVLSLFQATLTLPGIAGIVLTVGMAVDANVLIYERIREELLNGNSPNASIYTGYKKAFSTISDANLTTLIAAIALLTIGTGAIKGFAVTLVIGILSSMFTAIVGTRAIVSIVYENKKNDRLSI